MADEYRGRLRLPRPGNATLSRGTIIPIRPPLVKIVVAGGDYITARTSEMVSSQVGMCMRYNYLGAPSVRESGGARTGAGIA